MTLISFIKVCQNVKVVRPLYFLRDLLQPTDIRVFTM